MRASRKSLNIVSFALLGIFSLLAAGSMENSSNNHQNEPSSQASGVTTPAQTPKQELLSKIVFTYTWSTDGMIMNLSYKISNPTDHAFKDFEITCNHFAQSGTKIDSNDRTIYEAVAAHGKTSKRNFNMGFIHSQARTSSCSITDLVPTS